MTRCNVCNWHPHDVAVHGTCCSHGHPLSVVGTDASGRCRACTRVRGRRYHAANRERENARSRAYHAAHRDAILARKRAKRGRPRRGGTPAWPAGGRPYAPTEAHAADGGRRAGDGTPGTGAAALGTTAAPTTP